MGGTGDTCAASKRAVLRSSLYNSQPTNRTGRRMQSEMKSAVASPKNRYTAPSISTAAELEETVTARVCGPGVVGCRLSTPSRSVPQQPARN